ncbi:efflux RND transporter periplasmic adaptor subunit [Pseudoxanthomonas sp.]|uniref:efflux RND transporter periplasmic adaptor subunit n=1 Tax=Pseudoxanthomonas sp. TaxID=1871049 RepID=UPI002611A6E1|nr:efflux RND transporter periplasmic adaptor subunit [Pseudoxanthomonas sp.]WDS38004.1 MAG: efflux RND transporter periplasmic adaptor subunit [Pseudoxanthomonas sp.]
MKTISLISAMTLGLLLAACSNPTASSSDETAAGEDAHGHAETGTQADEDGHDAKAESTVIDAEQARLNGIEVAPTGPGDITAELQVQGVLTAVDGSVAQVTARYPGRIQALRASVGDPVRAGQTLASIESNLSLSTYAVTSPLSGVVLSRQAQVGGGAAEGQALFEVANLSRVWGDLTLFGADVHQVQAGQRVTVSRLYDGSHAGTAIERVLPGTVAASQSAVARATLDNADGQWRPGMAVTARIAIRTRQAALVVPRAAVQTMDGVDAVFVRSGDTYTVHPVTLGERDAHHVEVLSGLKAGEAVVVAQSYLIKADIEKSAAEHDH